MTTKCIACKTDIKDNAIICPNCQSYQRAWKNQLRFLAVAVGLLAIVSSAATYIWGEVTEWNRQRKWHDSIEVIDFSRSGESSFLNSGDGEIFLSYIHLRAPQNGWEQTIPINIPIRSGQFAIVPPTTSAANKLKEHRYRIGTDLPDAGFRRYLHATALWDDCVFFDVHYESGPVFQQIKRDLGDALQTFESTAELHYRSSFQGNWHSLTIPLRGFIYLSRHPNCLESLEGLLSNRANSADAKNQAAD